MDISQTLYYSQTDSSIDYVESVCEYKPPFGGLPFDGLEYEHNDSNREPLLSEKKNCLKRLAKNNIFLFSFRFSPIRN